MFCYYSIMPGYLRAATTAKAKGKRWPQIMKAAIRAGFTGNPVRLRMRMNAVIMRDVLSAYLDDRPPDEMYRAAQAVGSHGKMRDVWFFLQRGTDWPRVLRGEPEVGTPWRARRKHGRTRSTAKRDEPQLFVVRNGKARLVPYPTLSKVPSVLQPKPHRPR